MNTKPTHLDRDREIDLSECIAHEFASDIEKVFNSHKLAEFLSDDHLKAIAATMSAQADFPFTATHDQDKLSIHFIPEKGLKLKSLSDGITSVYKAIIKNFRAQDNMPECEQAFILAISTAFQPALMSAYTKADMPEGPHTGYIHRSC